MNIPLRVLFVEDSESDTELIMRILQRGGFDISYHRVEAAAEMKEALKTQEWDIVLSDYAMPQFDAPSALGILKESGCDIPFIVISGNIGESTAVGVMKAGAHDYLMKDNLPRLLPAVERELREAEIRRDRRKSRESQLQYLEQYMFLFNTMSQGVICQDSERKIISSNPAAQKILGLSWEHICARTDADIFRMALREDSTGFSPESYPAAKVLKTGKEVRDVVMGIFNPLSEEHRWIRINAIPKFVADNDKPYQIFSIFEDITERKRAEEERRKLEAQLRQAQKMEAVGQLAGGVAHDFNNLLYVITGYGEMIIDKLPPDEALHRNMREIMNATQRATTLVRQLLLFSRREAMQPKYLNLNELIGELMKMIRRIIGEHITLEVLPGFALKTVYADPGQIEQALMNLCVNARDAMPDGGKIIIETENIGLDAEYCRYLSWAKEGEYVLLTVSDTGCGIPYEIQERIFEPFFTTKEVGKGTGLGLAVVYGIVRSHQGMVRIYSEPGHGTAFKIYLPVAETLRKFFDHEKESAAKIAGGNEMILIAEDEEAVRNMIVLMLQKSGYRVISAKDGEEAMALFEKHSSEVDLALLDVIMPKASGQKVFERIKAIRPDIPILFSTGYSKSILNPDPSRAEQYEVIQKPVSLPVLMRKIREILDAGLKPS